MGMYNTIIVNCPNCGKEIKFQTKSGSRLDSEYSIKNVPKIEVKGIMGDRRTCPQCGKTVEIFDPTKEKVDASSLVNCY